MRDGEVPPVRIVPQLLRRPPVVVITLIIGRIMAQAVVSSRTIRSIQVVTANETAPSFRKHLCPSTCLTTATAMAPPLRTPSTNCYTAFSSLSSFVWVNFALTSTFPFSLSLPSLFHATILPANAESSMSIGHRATGPPPGTLSH